MFKCFSKISFFLVLRSSRTNIVVNLAEQFCARYFFIFRTNLRKMALVSENIKAFNCISFYCCAFKILTTNTDFMHVTSHKTGNILINQNVSMRSRKRILTSSQVVCLKIKWHLFKFSKFSDCLRIQNNILNFYYNILSICCHNNEFFSDISNK